MGKSEIDRSIERKKESQSAIRQNRVNRMMSVEAPKCEMVCFHNAEEKCESSVWLHGNMPASIVLQININSSYSICHIFMHTFTISEYDFIIQISARWIRWFNKFAVAFFFIFLPFDSHRRGYASSTNGFLFLCLCHSILRKFGKLWNCFTCGLPPIDRIKFICWGWPSTVVWSCDGK